MRSRFLGKVFQAFALAALIVGLVQGVYGDMWGELYLFLGGIVIFVVGRTLETRWEKLHQKEIPPSPLEQGDSV